MAKIIDRVRANLITEEIFTQEEIDNVLETEKYYPLESDEDAENGVMKYTNNKSEVWVKYSMCDGDYLVTDVTMRTKKRGNTKVRAFHSYEEIKAMMDYFRDNEKYDEFLTFTFGILLARRIGDTLSLKWSHFYEENGNRKSVLRTLVEEKTGKMIDVYISDTAWKYIDWYCEKTGINPMEHFNEDIFQSKWKRELPKNYTSEEYDKAIDKQAAKFRYEFKKAADANGIEGVSTHSLRKTYGYFVHSINKYDPDCLPTLQTIYGHESMETTKIYIDIVPEKAKKFSDDIGQVVFDADNGNKPDIGNSPVVELYTDDLRKIIMEAILKTRSSMIGGESDMHILAEILDMADKMRLG